MKTLESSDYNSENGTLTLNFTTGSLTTLRAGTPYLVKWESGENLFNPVFSGVTVSTIGGGHADTHYVDFVGSFSPVDIKANDNAVLYLGADNKLYYPSQNRTMGSCFVLNFGSDDTTGIVEVNADADLKSASHESGISNPLQRAWYDLQGRRLTGKPTAKGLYINNGKKVVIK